MVAGKPKKELKEAQSLLRTVNALFSRSPFSPALFSKPGVGKEIVGHLASELLTDLSHFLFLKDIQVRIL